MKTVDERVLTFSFAENALPNLRITQTAGWSSFFYCDFLLSEKQGGRGGSEKFLKQVSLNQTTKMAISRQIYSQKSSRSGSKNPPTATHLLSYIAKSRDILRLHRDIASYIGSAPRYRFIYCVCTAISLHILRLHRDIASYIGSAPQNRAKHVV